ncbi:MAG: hypothetical protein IJH50_01800 [Kiritimatiellae bacterium]|nr:hypothetical protein [Kiritimatiellia bacterium]
MKQFSATVLAAVAFASLFSAPVAEAARWTGGGATTDWNDADNWANGQLPSATSVVELTGNASVSLSSDCAASCIMNMADSPVTLTLTANADVRLAASICGDIAVEKLGNGRLSLAARQSYTGETRVIEGTLTTAPDLSYADYSAYGTLSVHLDASHPETLVADGNGDLSEWKSLTDNGVTVYGAAAANLYPSVTYPHANPSIIASDSYAGGRSAVMFGYTGGGATRACTFIAARKNGAAANFQARTFFFVQRQRDPSSEMGFLGMVKGYTFRFLRAGGNGWNLANMNEAWTNGRKAAGTATYEASAHTNLNLLVVRNVNLGSFEAIGTQYLIRDNGTAIGTSSSLIMDLHEILLFDEALTDAQIEDISAILMQKWNIPRQAACLNDSLLSAESEFSVEVGAMLDGGDSLQTLTEISGSGTFKTAGLVDLKGETLKVGDSMNVIGSGTITNTAAQKAALVVSNDMAATLSVHCAGNFDVEKQGSGTLYLADGQMHSGETRLTGGKLVGDHLFSQYGTMFVHLDSSHPETLVTDNNGDLVEWKSLTDNSVTVYGVAAANPYPSVTYPHANPSVIVSDPYACGRSAVMFGYTGGGATRACTFIAARKNGAAANFQARTFFFVQRQREPSSTSGFLGMVKGYTFRFLRENNNGWNMANMNEAWTNGRKATGTAIYEASAHTNLNLLVVRNANIGSFEAIGAQFLIRDNGTAVGTASSLIMDLHEVLLFEEALTDSQIDEISAILMQKWKIPQQVQPKLAFNGEIAPSSDFVVSGEATLDFAGLSPAVRALEFDATGMAEVPVLHVVGDWDVTQIPLTMTGFPGTMRGSFLSTGGKLTSPFASVSGCNSGRIAYETQSARIRLEGFYLIFK